MPPSYTDPFHPRRPALNRGLGGAVVGEEDHDRIFGEPLRFERLQDLADVGVDVSDHRIDPRDILGGLREPCGDRLVRAEETP